MNSLVHRVFPTRPVLGLTLTSAAVATIIAVAITAVRATTLVGTGVAYEGSWFLMGGGTPPTTCVYRHNDDQFVANNPGKQIFNFANYHRSFCTNGNEGVVDGKCPEKPDLDKCTGAVDEFHYGPMPTASATPMPTPPPPPAP